MGNSSYGSGQGATLPVAFKGDASARYEIEYSTASDFSNSEKRIVEGSGACTLERLAYGQEYYLRAKALGDGVSTLDSEYCGAFIVATPILTPVNDPGPQETAYASISL